MEEKNNVFKELDPNLKLPQESKAIVMDRLDMAKMFVEFWDLLVVNRVNVSISVLEQRSINIENNKDK